MNTYSAFHLSEVHYPTRPIGHPPLTKGRGVLHELAIWCITKEREFNNLQLLPRLHIAYGIQEKC